MSKYLLPESITKEEEMIIRIKSKKRKFMLLGSDEISGARKETIARKTSIMANATIR
jgi:hypothetical protein